MYGAYGLTELEARVAAITTCQGAGYGFHCNESTIVCEKLTSKTLAYSCALRHSLSNKYFLGRGRAMSDGIFRSREACQNDDLMQTYHCTVNQPQCSPL